MICSKHPFFDPSKCPYCEERAGLQKNILQGELLDLITLMPDSQTQEIVDYIRKLKEVRRRTRRLNGETLTDWNDEKKG